MYNPETATKEAITMNNTENATKEAFIMNNTENATKEAIAMSNTENATKEAIVMNNNPETAAMTNNELNHVDNFEESRTFNITPEGPKKLGTLKKTFTALRVNQNKEVTVINLNMTLHEVAASLDMIDGYGPIAAIGIGNGIFVLYNGIEMHDINSKCGSFLVVATDVVTNWFRDMTKEELSYYKELLSCKGSDSSEIDKTQFKLQSQSWIQDFLIGYETDDELDFYVEEPAYAFNNFAVDSYLPQYLGSENQVTRMDITSNGIFVCICMDKSQLEKVMSEFANEKGKLETKVVFKNNILLVSWRIGNMPWIHTTYTCYLSQNIPCLDSFDEIPVTFVLICGGCTCRVDGIQKYILDRTTTAEIRGAIHEQMNSPFDYAEFIRNSENLLGSIADEK